MISGSLRNYYRDEVNDSANETDDNDNKINNNKIITNKSFEYNTKIIRSTSNTNNILNAEVFVSLKYLSNFWRSLDLPLINRQIELDLTWTKNCLISKYQEHLEQLGIQLSRKWQQQQLKQHFK